MGWLARFWRAYSDPPTGGARSPVPSCCCACTVRCSWPPCRYSAHRLRAHCTRGRRGAVHHHGPGHRHRAVAAGISKGRGGVDRRDRRLAGGRHRRAGWALLLAERYGWRVTCGRLRLIALTAGPYDLASPAAQHPPGRDYRLRERLAVLGEPGVPIALLMSFLYMEWVPSCTAIYVAAIRATR